MKRTLLIVFLFGLVTSVRGRTATRTMAVTIDDLPYVKIGEGAYITRARAATSKILSTLKKHHAPPIGFVNERMLAEQREREARIALLRQWVDAGMLLGNHTYSHPDFNGLTIEQFQEEIVKGDEVTRQLMRSRQPYQLYFPHPMTHTRCILWESLDDEYIRKAEAKWAAESEEQIDAVDRGELQTLDGPSALRDLRSSLRK